jgi:RimJ/RimL family protein N-acetyltransferase
VHQLSREAKGPVGNSLLPAELDEPSAAATFIGVVGLKSLNSRSIALPDDLLNLPPSAATTMLAVGLDYMFLPGAWGKGYATESVEAVLETCKRNHSYWAPFPKLYVRSFACERNPASVRVLEKTMPRKGVFHWAGDPIFVGGEWRDHDDLHMYGMYLLE